MYDVSPLQNSLVLAPGETPASFVSRLAAMNRAASAREFSSDFLLSFKGVASGDEGELAKLAHLTGTNLDALVAFAPRKVSKEVFRLGREKISRRIAARQTVRICPACAQHDIQSNPYLPLDAAVAQRAIWLVGSIRTCEEHACSLITVSKSARNSLTHDFAHCSAEALEDIDRLFEHCAARPFSAFERYVSGRIWGDNAAGVALLDPLDIMGVDLICSWLGRFILVGPKGRPGGASDSEMYLAAQSGFEVLSTGAAAIRELIQTRHDQADFSDCLRPTDDRLLGHLYKFLDSEAGSRPQYEAIRRIMAAKLSELYPCTGKIARVLGITMERKKLYTLSDARLAYGLSRKTIKEYARIAGIGLTVKKNGQDVCYAIDAVAADKLFGTGHVLDAGTVERELGLNRWHLQNLCEARVISPVGGAFASGRTAFFRRNDIEKLANDLKARAKLVDQTPVGMVSVGEAAMRTGWSIGSIIEHVLGGKISATVVGDKRAYQALSVDPNQLREISTEPEGRLLNLREAARLVKIDDFALGKLATLGIVQVRDRRRSVTGRWQRTFEVSSLEAFQREYVTLSGICRKLRWHPQYALARVERSGAKPAFDLAIVRCRIYRRSELPELSAD
ncbi:TniQ family protein [Bosea massiliensis]|uniref:TniQ family protein n=1 Tax=Bosea massiliensis TaxID=151419 RepID=A0ABW0P320_9HYPH